MKLDDANLFSDTDDAGSTTPFTELRLESAFGNQL